MTKNQALNVLRKLPKREAYLDMDASESTITEAWLHAPGSSRIAKAIDVLGGVEAAADVLSKDEIYWG